MHSTLHKNTQEGHAKDQPRDKTASEKHGAQSNSVWQSLALRPGGAASESTRQQPAAAGETGQPLDPAIRYPMEQFFQRPLDRVRVATGEDSRRAANSLGALAFTLGQNIHLGERGQALQGNQRQGLLAHEVVHTLQQGNAAQAPQLSAIQPDAEASPHEHEADTLAHAFMAHRAGHSAGLAIRDSIGIHRFAATGRAQLSKVPTKYGEFEDYKWNDVKNAAGTSVGVQLYLKFHPGNNVDAKKIGLTQAATGTIGGTLITQGFYGRRQATAGAGTGYFIDMLEGVVSPMYRAEPNVTAGEDPTKIGSYAAPGISPLTPAQAGSLSVTGLDYGGGSVYGYRYMDGATLKGPVAAELHDAPHIQRPVLNDSEQIFETAALAFEGKMAGTYLGSVEWGWRRDATGAFTSIPISIKSMGVPTVNFLTAASVWNTVKEFYGLVANATPRTNIMKLSDVTKVDFDVPQGTGMRPVGRAVPHGAATYYPVTVVDGRGRPPGLVNAADTTIGDFGRETVDLPVPEIYTVNTANTVLDGETRCSPSDPVLPLGTRVRLLGPFGNLPEYGRVEVADGPLTGTRGVILRRYLTRETLGTH